MLSSWDGFRRWNISVRIDRYNAFWGLIFKFKSKTLVKQSKKCVKRFTYLSSSGVECSSTLTLSFLGLAFLGKHGVMASSSWDNHGCIGVSTLNTLVKHDVLRIVLPIKDKENQCDEILSVTRTRL